MGGKWAHDVVATEKENQRGISMDLNERDVWALKANGGNEMKD